MKKVKKILSLSVASLLMSGLVINAPQNTKTASAGVVHTKHTEEGAKIIPRSINNRYVQLISLRTKDPKTGKKGEVKLLISKNRYGYLQLEISKLPPGGHVFDDDYAFVVISSKNAMPRLKWTTTFNKKPSVYAELTSLIAEFNRIKVGYFDKIAVIGRNSLNSVLWETSSGNALIRHGYNRWEKGFDSEWNKYGTLFRVLDNGLDEERNIWGNKDLFIYP